ncbi:MAG: PAS domain S-box protein [Curvibacter sp.]
MLSVSQNIGFFSHPDPLTRWIDGWSYMVVVSVLSVSLATALREMRQASNELRIAATAFECQEGMIITDANLNILRTNRSFTRIMGYTEAEVLGKTTVFMRSDRHPDSFYENAWRTAHEEGIWSDETWHRRKNGEVFPQWLTATAVKDADGNITNFVVTHTDITYRKQKEAEQHASQIAQRDALVREVHHHIKNNLQGITGLLRQFAQANPAISEPLHEAIGQVRSIAVIHGLQGRSSEPTVRLCELIDAISGDISTLWQTPIQVNIPGNWKPCRIVEAEAVPLALILNELLINSVKHGSPLDPGVKVCLRKLGSEDRIEVCISNQGRLPPEPTSPHGLARNGLQLVDALLPHSGAQLLHREEGGMIHVQLTLEPPVISLETRGNPYDPEPNTQSPSLAGG